MPKITKAVHYASHKRNGSGFLPAALKEIGGISRSIGRCPQHHRKHRTAQPEARRGKMRNDGGPGSVALTIKSLARRMAKAAAQDRGESKRYVPARLFAAAAMGQMLHAEICKDAWAHVGAVAVDAYKMATHAKERIRMTLCESCGKAPPKVRIRRGRRICTHCESKRAVAWAIEHPERKRASNATYLSTPLGLNTQAQNKEISQRIPHKYPPIRRCKPLFATEH